MDTVLSPETIPTTPEAVEASGFYSELPAAAALADDGTAGGQQAAATLRFVDESHKARQQARTPAKRERCQLAADHLHRVVRRPGGVRMELNSVVGLTWLLKGRLFAPLGDTSLLVQYSDDGKPTQVCVTGRLDTSGISPLVRYDNVRMVHDWGINPRPGGTGRVLDPRRPTDAGVREGDRPNAAWVLAGLRVDAERLRARTRSAALPASPTFPSVCYGYKSKPGFSGLTPFLSAYIERMSAEERYSLPGDGGDSMEQLGEKLFDKFLVTPEESGLSVFLVPMVLMASPGKYERVYEDFRELVGQEVPNPLAGLSQVRASNPVWDAARKARIHLRTLWNDLAVSTHTDGVEADLQERVDDMVHAMRDQLGVTSDAFEDFDIIEAMLKPDDQIVSTKGILDMTAEQREDCIRDAIAIVDDLKVDVTDEDVAAAVANPQRPLLASKMGKIQCLYRDAQLPIAEALTFQDEHWPIDAAFVPSPDWSPARRRR